MSSRERVNEPPDTFRPVSWVPGVRRPLRILSQPPLSVVSASATVSDINFASVLSPVYFSLYFFLSLQFFPFTSRRLMLLAVFYLLLTLALSAFFHFFSPPPPSPFFVFWLGLLSGASWGNAWSLSVGTTIHVCVFLFVSCAFFPPSISTGVPPCICSDLPLRAKCFDQMSQLVARCSYHRRHDHDQRCWHLLCLCYVSVFVLHLYLGYISAITCSPLMEHILMRVSRSIIQMHNKRNVLYCQTTV